MSNHGKIHQEEFASNTYAALRRSKSKGLCRNAPSTSTTLRSVADACAWNATAAVATITECPAARVRQPKSTSSLNKVKLGSRPSSSSNTSRLINAPAVLTAKTS